MDYERDEGDEGDVGNFEDIKKWREELEKKFNLKDNKEDLPSFWNDEPDESDEAPAPAGGFRGKLNIIKFINKLHVGGAWNDVRDVISWLHKSMNNVKWENEKLMINIDNVTYSFKELYEYIKELFDGIMDRTNWFVNVDVDGSPLTPKYRSKHGKLLNDPKYNKINKLIHEFNDEMFRNVIIVSALYTIFDILQFQIIEENGERHVQHVNDWFNEQFMGRGLLNAELIFGNQDDKKYNIDKLKILRLLIEINPEILNHQLPKSKQEKHKLFSKYNSRRHFVHMMSPTMKLVEGLKGYRDLFIGGLVPSIKMQVGGSKENEEHQCSSMVEEVLNTIIAGLKSVGKKLKDTDGDMLKKYIKNMKEHEEKLYKHLVDLKKLFTFITRSGNKKIIGDEFTNDEVKEKIAEIDKELKNYQHVERVIVKPINVMLRHIYSPIPSVVTARIPTVRVVHPDAIRDVVGSMPPSPNYILSQFLH